MDITISTRGNTGMVDVHKSGCRDIIRHHESYNLDAFSQQEVVLDLYPPDCFESVDEDGSGWRAESEAVKFFPCVKLPYEVK